MSDRATKAEWDNATSAWDAKTHTDALNTMLRRNRLDPDERQVAAWHRDAIRRKGGKTESFIDDLIEGNVEFEDIFEQNIAVPNANMLVKKHSPGTWGVAYISPHTGDVEDWHSLHDTKRQALSALRRAAQEKED